MKRYSILLTAAFLVCSASLKAQDMLYMKGGVSEKGKITEISPDKIKYINAAGAALTVDLSKVALVFNAAGDFLVFADNVVDDKEKIEFLKPPAKQLSSAVLIMTSGSVLTSIIESEDAKSIKSKSKRNTFTIQKSELAALIRQNGTHQVFLSADIAAPLLTAAKPGIKELLTETIPVANNVVTPITSNVNAAPANNAPISNSSVTKPPVKAPVSAPVKTAAVNTPVPAKPAAKNNEVITSGEAGLNMELFGKKAIQKTEEFSTYLQTISAVNTTREKVSKSIDLACDLFVNEEARVEVSSASAGTKNKFKIRDYLNRLQLRNGQYDKIKIEYANISYASDFKKGADGNYYGIVSFVQTFKGFIDGKLIYGDKTKRNVQIILKQYDKEIEGSSSKSWDVFLSDIGVVETKRI